MVKRITEVTEGGAASAENCCTCRNLSKESEVVLSQGQLVEKHKEILHGGNSK